MAYRINTFEVFFENYNTLLETSRVKMGPNLPEPIKPLFPVKPTKTAYDKLVDIVAKEKKLDKEKINDVLYKIAWHETGKTLDPKQKQKGGPGLGLYQYEPASLKTAIARISNYWKKKNMIPPKWLDVVKTTWDATKLSPKQQSYVALIDMLERKNFNFAKATKGDKELVEEWGKGWQTKNDPKKKKKFLSELPLYYQAKSLKKVNYLEPVVKKA
jgi:hypothetical protein